MLKFFKDLLKKPEDTYLTEEEPIKDKLFDIKTFTFKKEHFYEVIDKGDVYNLIRQLITTRSIVTITDFFNDLFDKTDDSLFAVIKELMTMTILIDLACLQTNDIEGSISKDSFLFVANQDILQLITILKNKYQLEIYNDVDSKDFFEENKEVLKAIGKFIKEDIRQTLSSKTKLLEQQFKSNKELINLLGLKSDSLNLVKITNIDTKYITLSVGIKFLDEPYTYKVELTDMFLSLICTANLDFLSYTMFKNISILYLLQIFVY
jgi:hypothetical protein